MNSSQKASWQEAKTNPTSESWECQAFDYMISALLITLPITQRSAVVPAPVGNVWGLTRAENGAQQHNQLEKVGSNSLESQETLLGSGEGMEFLYKLKVLQ